MMHQILRLNVLVPSGWDPVTVVLLSCTEPLLGFGTVFFHYYNSGAEKPSISYFPLQIAVAATGAIPAGMVIYLWPPPVGL